MFLTGTHALGFLKIRILFVFITVQYSITSYSGRGANVGLQL